MQIQEFFRSFDWFMGGLGGIALAIGFANFTKAVVDYRTRYSRHYADQEIINAMAMGGNRHFRRKLAKDMAGSLLLAIPGACAVLMAVYANPQVPLKHNHAFRVPLLVVIILLTLGGLLTLAVAVDPIFRRPFKDVRVGIFTAFMMMGSGMLLAVMTALPTLPTGA